MTKTDVLTHLSDQSLSDREKYSTLLSALQSAPIKSLNLVSYYNRSGFTRQNFVSIKYDVQKAWDISRKELSSFKAKETEKVSSNFKLDQSKEDLKNLSWPELRSLNSHVCDELKLEERPTKKADIIEFLSQFTVNEVDEDLEASDDEDVTDSKSKDEDDSSGEQKKS